MLVPVQLTTPSPEQRARGLRVLGVAFAGLVVVVGGSSAVAALVTHNAAYAGGAAAIGFVVWAALSIAIGAAVDRRQRQ
jgi:hypothetical protein